MSPLILYADSRLPCPQRVLLLCKQLNIEIQVREIAIDSGFHKDSSFLQKNPFGSLPVLEDRSYNPPLIMYESRAVARYLAAEYGRGEMLPAKDDKRAWAKFEQAASVEVTAFDVVANRLVFELYFKRRLGSVPDDSGLDECAIAAMRARLSQVLDVLDGILAFQMFTAGPTVTIVDLFYLPYMHHLTTIVWQDCLNGRNNLKRWWLAVQSLKCYEVMLNSM